MPPKRLLKKMRLWYKITNKEYVAIFTIINFRYAIMYDDIALFIQVVKSGGLAPAGQSLGISAATMTRRMQKLESTLACRLIHRSSQRFELTPEGKTYFEAYADLVSQFDATYNHLKNESAELVGRLKVLAPNNISNGMLQPMWSAFIHQYPSIQLEISLSNNLEDFVQAKADIALRIGPQNSSNLYQKQLGEIPTGIFATPGYLAEYGTPQDFNALKQHRIIGAKAIASWDVIHSISKKQLEIHPDFSVLVNDVTLATQFCLNGLGLCLLPFSETKNFLARKELVRVLPEWHGPKRKLYAIWSTGRLLNKKACVLRDFIAKFIEEHFDFETNA